MGPLLGLLAVLAVVGLVMGLVVLASRGLPKLNWKRTESLPDTPVPDGWAEMLYEWFPLSRTLSDEHFDRLLKLTQRFVENVRFEGADGFEVTELARVLVAAQACYLIVGVDGPLYPSTRAIVLYPSTFVPSRPEAVGQGGIHHPDQALLGESWNDGTVVLAWDSVVKGATNPGDGRNLIFHEFAHQLDQEDGDAGGIPPGMEPGAMKEWARVLEERFDFLREARDRGTRTVLSHYGATNPAEFFAVAVEAFFEKPLQLSKSKPDVYQHLSAMLGRDPATELMRHKQEQSA